MIQKFSLKKLLIVWSALTILLILLAPIVLIYIIKVRAFFVVLFTINAALFSCFVLLRKNIERSIAKFLDESKNLTVNIKYNNEKKIWFVLAPLFIISCGYIISLALYDIKSYSHLIKEDGIVEYCSALFWLLSAIIVYFYTIKLSKVQVNRHQFISNLLLIFFFVVCCGEEISWGQRLLNIETPRIIESINVQNEINLHNIGSISVFSNIFFFLTITFFLLVPFLVQRNNRIKNLLYLLHFPIPNKFAMYIYIMSLFVWIFIGLRFGTLGFHPFSFFPEQYYTQMDDEVFELFAAYSFLCFNIFNYTKEVSIFKKTVDPTTLIGFRRPKYHK